MALLHVQNLSFRYHNEQHELLSSIGFEISRGEFMLLCGPSGCGKTTLLRLLKPGLEPKGDLSGGVAFKGEPVTALTKAQAASKIGLVMQNPDSQIVCDTVSRELAFGLECLGTENAVLSKRVAETVSYFGIERLYNKKTYELSGGEKQLVILASIMAMRPELLLLDEPSSRLDPIAARDLYDLLQRINLDLGTTIILTEHRIDEVFSLADKVAVMHRGRLAFASTPGDAAAYLFNSPEEKLSAMTPLTVRLYHELSAKREEGDCSGHCHLPVTVREAKDWFEREAKSHGVEAFTGVAPRKENKKSDPAAIKAESLSFRFEKDGDDIIHTLSLQIYKREFLSIVGGNGAGKTTLLRLLAGILKPYRGKIISLPGLRTVYLPQNPQSLFAYDSVREDLLSAAGGSGSFKQFLNSSGILPAKTIDLPPNVVEVAEKLEINQILEKHPLDLSCGELQRAALGMLLLRNPDVILLDEPTKGIDAYSKSMTSHLLKSLCAEGKAIVTVTHDLEFAAENSDRCAMLFNGDILNAEAPGIFFGENMFYTTVVHRIAGGVMPGAVTLKDVKSKWL